MDIRIFEVFGSKSKSQQWWDTYFICTFLSFVLVRVRWKPCDSCCRYVPKDFPKRLQKRTVDSRPFHCVVLHWPNNVNGGKMCLVGLLQKKGSGFLFIIVTDKCKNICHRQISLWGIWLQNTWETVPSYCVTFEMWNVSSVFQVSLGNILIKVT